MAELLILKGADINATLLSYQKRTIYLFIKVKKNLTKKFYKKKNTPLHIAAEQNSVEVADVLISKGANIDALTINYLKMILLWY